MGEGDGKNGPERICGEKLRVNPQSMLVWWSDKEHGLSHEHAKTLYVDGLVQHNHGTNGRPRQTQDLLFRAS